jgi:hypothetical protein
MSKIYIVDSIMGSGKTSSAINKMEGDTKNNYIFITPYLDEVKRIIDNCPTKHFVQPENKGKGKLDSLHYLIGNHYNIASTHALFSYYNNYTKDLLNQGEYILILDEVCQVVEIVDLSKSDLDNILQNHAHVEDNMLIWDDEKYVGRFDDIKAMALNKNLIVFGEQLLMWSFPVDIFKSFKEVYILTYMFKAQQQKYYYDYYNVVYEYIGVENKDGIYLFSENPTIPNYVRTLKDKITILDDDKLNSIGEDYYALSSTWFKKEQITRNKFLVKKLKNNIANYFSHRISGSSEDNMWTCYKDSQKYLAGKGYTKKFVSVNARATNEYRNRKNLAYCVNVFFNPIIKQFFQTKNIKIYEETYALSELVQWVWRSAIRDGECINLYIPSSRMRKLLINWLDELSRYEIDNININKEVK